MFDSYTHFLGAITEYYSFFGSSSNDFKNLNLESIYEKVINNTDFDNIEDEDTYLNKVFTDYIEN